MLVDIHAHIQFDIFSADEADILSRAKSEGVYIVAPSTKLTTSRKAITFARKHKGLVFAAVGLHPLYANEAPYDPHEEIDPQTAAVSGEEYDVSLWRPLAEDPSVVALGEVGLDYIKRLTVGHEERRRQEEVLRQQLELALEVQKPVILHCRDGEVAGAKRNAHDDMLAVIAEYVPRGLRGVSHCFSGNKIQAKEYMRLGFGLSFTGLVTYNGAWDKIIAASPLEMLFTETDSPYLTPVPHRGERNEPAYVRFVAEHIAKIKELSPERVSQQTAFNATMLFGLPL